MASCSECTDEVVVEDSVDSDGTASPLRHGRILGRDKFSSQTSAGLTEPAGGMENSRLLCTQEGQMFSSSEEDSEHSQLLLPQSLQISSHLSHLKPPGANSPVLPPHLSHLKPQGATSPVLPSHLSHLKQKGENSPVLPPHLSHLKPPGENSPVFPPPAKLRKLAGETRTKEESAANVDNDSDVTNLSDNIEPRPEHNLGDTSHDLAGEEKDGGQGMEGCHGDHNSKCSWEDQQTKSSAGVKQTAAVPDSSDRSAAATESIEETKLSKVHQEGDFGKERITNENGRERSETCVEKGKEVKSITDVSEGRIEKGKEGTRTAGISDGSVEKGKDGTRGPDVSKKIAEVCRRTGSSESSSLGSLQESVAAVSDIGADRTLCHQHEEEMQLLGRLEGRQEKLNPLLSTKDRAAALKVQRELSCIQTLIGTLIQAHQRQRTAISSLRDSEQMQEQMRLFVQRHKRLVQIFSAQKTATAKFKGRMEVTTTQSNTKVTSNIANQSQPTSQTSSGKNERDVLIGRKSIGGKKGKKSTASSTTSGSSSSSNVIFQGAEPSGKETLRADQKLPQATFPITAEAASGESTTAMQVLQALDGSSQLRAVIKTGSLQKGQIVNVVSKDGQESVRYRVVGMESVSATASTNNQVDPNIQYDSENVARCTATVVSTVGHTTATVLSSVSGKQAPAATNNRVAPNIQHGGENVARSTATVVSNVGRTTATALSPASSKLAQLAQQANVTTDSSRAWKTPFKPSNTASSVARLAEEETQDVSDVAKTNAREEKLNNTKGTEEAGVSAQSKAEVLWQKIVPQVQKQLVTSAKPQASGALKECLVGNKGLSTTGGAGGQLQGLSTTGVAGGQHTQGPSTTGGAGGQLRGLSTTGVAGGQLNGLSTTGGAGGQLQGQSTTGRAGGQLQGPSTTDVAGRQLQGLSTSGVIGGQLTQVLSTTGRAGGQLQGLSTTGVAGGQLKGLFTTDVAGRQLQGLSTTGKAGEQLTQGLSTTGGARGQCTQGLSTTAVVEGLPQVQGTEVPTVTELLRAKLIQPGKDVLSCRGKAGLQFASLSLDGAVSQGGLTFSTVAQWHRALWGLRTAQKRAMVYRQVCYRGTPLADISSVATPVEQTVSPAHLQQTGVTPAGQTFSPAPAHLSSSKTTCAEDVEMMEEQQPFSQSQQQPLDVSLPSSSSTSPGKTAPQDSRVLRPASILLITDEEFFISRLRLPDKFWDSAEVKLNQFLEAAVNFE